MTWKGTLARAELPAVTPPPTTGITMYGCSTAEAALARELAPDLGVSPAITHVAPTEDTVALVAGSRCVGISHRSRVTNATLRALSGAGVAYISTRSIGCNHLDVRYAASLGIRVENVAYSPDSVADYTLMLILMAIRHAKSVLGRADTHDYRPAAMRGRELRDLTVGVVGSGRIGAAVIDRLRAFGCRVLAHDTSRKTAAEYVPLDALLRRSDVVTLHTPLTATTHHLFDRRRLGLMKHDAVLVNTARGGLVDTLALIDALEEGRLGGAALDVVEGEEGTFYADCRGRPVDARLARLHGLPNVIVSPHAAYDTDHALRDIVANSLINCLNFERGAHE